MADQPKVLSLTKVIPFPKAKATASAAPTLLGHARALGMTSFLIVGRDYLGQLVLIADTNLTAEQVNWMLDVVKSNLLGSQK